MSASERLRAEIRGEIEAGQKEISDRLSRLRGSLGVGPDTPEPSRPQPPTPPVVENAAAPLGANSCPTCSGSGRCWYCGATATYQEQACTHCYGSGKCVNCAGTGRCYY